MQRNSRESTLITLETILVNLLVHLRHYHVEHTLLPADRLTSDGRSGKQQLAGATVRGEHSIDGGCSPYYAAEVFFSDLHSVNLPD